MANRSSLNNTEEEQEEDERERMMREAQVMLREMRFRSCAGQKKVADKEKTEAEKCKFKHSEKHVHQKTDLRTSQQMFKSQSLNQLLSS